MTAPDPSPELLLARAIAARESPGFADAMFDWLQHVAQPDNLVALSFRGDDPPEVLARRTSAAPVFAALDGAYRAGAYLLDPFHALHVNTAPVGAYALAEVAPDAFPRSRYFTEYFRDTTLRDELAFVARPRAGTTLMIFLGRDATSGRRFGPRALQAARSVAPIVAALAERHWSLPSEPRPSPLRSRTQLTDAVFQAHGIRLSPRQTEVALLILRGHSTASIAARLGLSPQTIKVFRRQIYERCAISTQAELFSLLVPHLPLRRSDAPANPGRW